jgi:hypothetical protein
MVANGGHIILLSVTVLMTVFADAILTYSQGAAKDLRQHPQS